MWKCAHILQRKRQDDGQLESIKAKILEAREENERLKAVLSGIRKDYQSLQVHFFNIMQQDQPAINPSHKESFNAAEEHDISALSLGTTSSGEASKKAEDQKSKDVDEEEVAGLSPVMKRSRVSVRARCDAPTVRVLLLVVYACMHAGLRNCYA